MSAGTAGRVLALTGGIGGTKLALGLSRVLPAERLSVVANTGDDFRHLGLHVSPDVDTLVYTLAGLANPETGWGLAGDTGQFMAALARLGGETWFFLGDRDLATHVERTRRLAAGEALGAITADLARRLGIGCEVLPMSDDAVPTIVETAGGPLAFQHYFVRDQCRPAVTGFRHDGADRARPHPRLAALLAAGDLAAIVVCPSNPFISIDPILSRPGVRRALADARPPRIVVSPIVGGRAIKGPTAKMLAELGLETSSLAIARHYAGLIDGIVLDGADAGLAGAIQAEGVAVRVTDTVMRDLADRERLAAEVLDFAAAIMR